jgi:hypothetical protein
MYKYWISTEPSCQMAGGIYNREHFRPYVAEIHLKSPFFRNPKLTVTSGFLVSVTDLKSKCSFRSSSSKQSREGDDSC